MGINEKNKLENLVIKAKIGDMQAKEEIIKLYKIPIECKASKFFIKGYERDDLISEGYGALLIAINKYNQEKKCFHTYATRAIENKLIDLLRVNKEDKDKKSINLTEEISDFLESNEMPIEEEAYFSLLRNKIEELPDEEREVIKKLYLKEKTIREIAIDKGVSYSQIQYIRNKGLCTLRGIV